MKGLKQLLGHDAKDRARPSKAARRRAKRAAAAAGGQKDDLSTALRKLIDRATPDTDLRGRITKLLDHFEKVQAQPRAPAGNGNKAAG